MTLKVEGVVVCLLLLSACASGTDTSEPVAGAASGYRLTTLFTGPDRPLGVETGENGETIPVLADSIQGAGQQWVFSPQGDDHYRISAAPDNNGTVLAVVEDGVFRSVALSPPTDNASQLWSVTPLSNGFCRITSQLLGQGSSLDIVNDDVDRLLKMSTSGDFSGQFWQFDNIQADISDTLLSRCIGKPEIDTPDSGFIPTWQYRKVSIRGFTVLFSPEVDAQPSVSADTFSAIESQLATIEAILPAEVFAELQKVSLWVEDAQKMDSSGAFHPSEAWLTDNGYNPEKAGAAEISNAALFLEEFRTLKISVVLHELAHARQFYSTDKTLEFESTYQSAVLSGIYESVLYADGTSRRAYALTDDKEYFAELSEAYFGTNDFYPFNRDELSGFDTDGYRLITRAWGLAQD